MKASELIESLKWRIDEFGDCEVNFGNWNDVRSFLPYAGFIPEDKLRKIKTVSVESRLAKEDVIVLWD